MFSHKGGHTWDVHRSGFLWLAQFGDMAPAASGPPSQARIDIDARRQALTMEPGSGCSVATWAQPLGCYLTAALEPGTDDSIPIWTYSDDMRIEGAEPVNGSFEAPGEGGIPVGWGSEGGQGMWIHDPEPASDGEYLVKTSHNHRFTQHLAVTGGRTMTISL